MWADLFGSLSLIDKNNPTSVRRTHQIVQIVWVCGLVAAFLLLKRTPADLIIAGHFVLGAIMTPLLMFAICWMAFHTDRRVRMSKLSATLLLTSAVVMLACVGANLVTQLSSHEKAPAASSASSVSAPAESR
jgi:ABC-type transport system involved in cytochrome c biogenesis permease subunit